ncbi:MAG: HNH endonuclease [Candidatus Thiodiazotropha taylori]|uniref:HNH endonuclease n=1 Tax=Candidatus Thiodiazotropha taylori TaxID=2792791 RepID=A0A9E4N5B1_9GAMM|nr:HNH endonuclease [Candidatus Thiodiazotropha taylori]MCW4257743.1 HNH endonuclease [Candidatus Thiodiazotropha taylori]
MIRNRMWESSKQTIKSGDNSTNLMAQRDINIYKAVPRAIVDEKINERLALLRKSRFFAEFDITGEARRLGNQILPDGELSGGTNSVKCVALAWCARLLARSGDLEDAEKYLCEAKSFDNCDEITIAEAFLLSQKDDKAAALTSLANIDSPASRSAALMIFTHHEGKEKAFQWLIDAGVGMSDLDADGKYFLLSQQIEASAWDEVRQSAEKISEQDLVEAPILNHMLAVTWLSPVVPEELRSVVLYQLPFDASEFPLASDVNSIEARKKSQNFFVDAAKAAEQLNCPRAAGIDQDYALWLELRDQDNSQKGMQYLEEKLHDPSSALRLVPLALQFGIKLDLSVVEAEINKQIALHGEITFDAAGARFALALTQKTPEQIANYIEQHYESLSKYINPNAMRSIQIETLSKAGLPEKAHKHLELLLAEGITTEQENRLRRIISESEGSDPVEARKKQFKESDSLSDLVALIDELSNKELWNDVCEYGLLLFERTRSLKDAQQFVDALNRCQRSSEIIRFLDDHSDLREQSKTLRYFYAWALYDEGKFMQVLSVLEELGDERDNLNYRTLKINLGISIGDWNSVSEIVAYEHTQKDNRNAQDILRTAQLALHLGLPYAKDLLFTAVEKASDDPVILSSAYFLASNAGLEDNETVVQWLHKAAALSGDNGPIQMMSTKDIFDRKPEWDRRESETWRMLSNGEIPQFLVGQSLNKTLVDLTVFPALLNITEPDPRRRSAIPAFSGNRLPVSFKPEEKVVGMDATALLTWAFLGVLDKALDAFKFVYIPHGVLAWLFEEKQKVAFHQPNRIKNAYKVRDLISSDLLEKQSFETKPESDLSALVGDELALLISEAMNVENDDKQRLVVRSAPVHRVSSFMEEEADLSQYAHVMSSCLAIVEKLREKGQITSEEEKRAKDYFTIRERTWPDQPEINDNAILYLDSLTISYFLHAGILEKLHAAGFRAIVSPREISEENALISYESISDKVSVLIENIRLAINSRIESGQIRIGRRLQSVDQEDEPISEHPTAGAIALAGSCDAVIMDDRFFNQHAYVGEADKRSFVYSTLDVLEALASSNKISGSELSEYRTSLRRAGYFCIPVFDEEIEQHLNAASVKDGKVMETAELRAIREIILRVRMSDWLQLPKEAYWLDSTIKTFLKVFKKIWSEEEDVSCAISKSNWALDQIDIRGWAHRLIPEARENAIGPSRGIYILMLLSPPLNVSQDVREAYSNWVEETVLKPIKEQFPEVYDWIVQWEKDEIAKLVEEEFPEGEAS